MEIIIPETLEERKALIEIVKEYETNILAMFKLVIKTQLSNTYTAQNMKTVNGNVERSLKIKYQILTGKAGDKITLESNKIVEH